MAPTQQQDLAMLSALSNPPQLPFFVDATSHQHVWDTWLSGTLAEVFPLTRRPSPALLSEDVRVAVEQKRRASYIARSFARRASSPLRVSLLLWKHLRFSLPRFTRSVASEVACPVRLLRCKRSCVDAAITLANAIAAQVNLKAAFNAGLVVAAYQQKDDLIRALHSPDMTRTFQAVKSLERQRNWVPQPHPAVELEDGTLATCL